MHTGRSMVIPNGNSLLINVDLLHSYPTFKEDLHYDVFNVKKSDFKSF